MKFIDKVKCYLGLGTFEESMTLYSQKHALAVKKMMDKFETNPTGSLASVPKMARAFQFYMTEPASFRSYCDIRYCMGRFLKANGIDAPDSALGDVELLLPYLAKVEESLPRTGSIFEQWAMNLYEA